ncbi:MAG: SDR family oxidoreductase [Anaerolineales bacterium]|nr:SDR family oxidoreductase [Anaerolineales bacterium]
MKKLLLTGAAGFLGRAIAHHFSQQGWQVYGLDRVSAENAPLADLKEYAALNLPHPRLNELLAQWNPQACIHAAGRASVPQSMQDPASDFQDGPALTFYLLDALKQYAPQCAFIFLSSAAVYGNPVSLPIGEDLLPAPISVYGYHKWQSEILCHEYASLFGLKTASARLFSAYGPGLHRQVIWDITQKALTQDKIILQGDGSESRDFLHSADIAGALECILRDSPLHGEAYNVASGIETNIAELSAMILNSAEISKPIIFSGETPDGTPKNWQADISSLSRSGFSPRVNLNTGVESFVRWAMKEIDLNGKN